MGVWLWTVSGLTGGDGREELGFRPWIENYTLNLIESALMRDFSVGIIMRGL